MEIKVTIKVMVETDALYHNTTDVDALTFLSDDNKGKSRDV